MKGSLQRIFLSLDILENLRQIAEVRLDQPSERLNRNKQRLQVEHEESLVQIKDLIAHERQQLNEEHQRILNARRSKNKKELTGSVQGIQDRFDSEAKQLITEIKRLEIEFSEAKWLAEAVIEESQKKLHRDREQKKKTIRDLTNELLSSKTKLSRLRDKTMFIPVKREDSQSDPVNADLNGYRSKIAECVDEANQLSNAKLPRVFRGIGPSVSLALLACIVGLLTSVASASFPLGLGVGILFFIAPIVVAVHATKLWGKSSADLITRMSNLASSQSRLEMVLNEKWAEESEDLRQKEWEAPLEIERKLKAAREKNDALLEEARDSARTDAREAHDTLSPKLEAELQKLEDQIDREAFALREKHANLERHEHRKYQESLQQLISEADASESQLMAEWESGAVEFAQLIKHPENQDLLRFDCTMSSHEDSQEEDQLTSVPAELFIGVVDPATYQSIHTSDSDLLRSLLEPDTRVPVGISLVDPELVVTRSGQASRSEAIEFHKKGDDSSSYVSRSWQSSFYLH